MVFARCFADQVRCLKKQKLFVAAQNIQGGQLFLVQVGWERVIPEMHNFGSALERIAGFSGCRLPVVGIPVFRRQFDCGKPAQQPLCLVLLHILVQQNFLVFFGKGFGVVVSHRSSQGNFCRLDQHFSLGSFDHVFQIVVKRVLADSSLNVVCQFLFFLSFRNGRQDDFCFLRVIDDFCQVHCRELSSENAGCLGTSRKIDV